VINPHLQQAVSPGARLSDWRVVTIACHRPFTSEFFLKGRWQNKKFRFNFQTTTAKFRWRCEGLEMLNSLNKIIGVSHRFQSYNRFAKIAKFVWWFDEKGTMTGTKTSMTEHAVERSIRGDVAPPDADEPWGSGFVSGRTIFWITCCQKIKKVWKRRV